MVSQCPLEDAFLHFADERYSLAFVVMPSHHHWLFLPNEDWSLRAVKQLRQKRAKMRTPREIISHSIQSYTSTMCNRIRGKSGSYWQTETFDHWARDEAEMYRIIHYIETNPVKAAWPDELRIGNGRPQGFARSRACSRATQFGSLTWKTWNRLPAC